VKQIFTAHKFQIFVLLTNSLTFVNVGALAALSSPQSKVITPKFSVVVVVRQFIIRHFQNKCKFEALYCIESLLVDLNVCWWCW